MVVWAKVCELTDGFLWFVCGLYVEILTSPLMALCDMSQKSQKQPTNISLKQFVALSGEF